MPLHVLARVQRPVPRRAARAGALHAARGALALRRVRVEVLEVLLLLLGLLPLEALLLVPLPVRLLPLLVPPVLLLSLSLGLGHAGVAAAVDVRLELLPERARRLKRHARHRHLALRLRGLRERRRGAVPGLLGLLLDKARAAPLLPAAGGLGVRATRAVALGRHGPGRAVHGGRGVQGGRRGTVEP